MKRLDLHYATRQQLVPIALMSAVESSCTCSRFGTMSSSATTGSRVSNTNSTQRRHLKVHDVREYKPLCTPVEFRFYQRYTNSPGHQSGVQFLSHFESHRRWTVRHSLIDYMNWGKEQGQAHLPHRQQRVAFDFNDKVHPTRLPRYVSSAKFEGQDPSVQQSGGTQGNVQSFTGGYDPYKPVLSAPDNMNRLWGTRRPEEIKYNIHRDQYYSTSAANQVVRHTDTADDIGFGNANLPQQLEASDYSHTFADPMAKAVPQGRIPGVHIPFRGEPDNQHMQAMSVPLSENNLVTGNDGRFSKTVFMNYPERHQVLTNLFSETLNEQLDLATNGVHSKLTVLKAAQSGLSEFFCKGADFEQYSYDLAMANKIENELEENNKELSQLKGKLASKNKESARMVGGKGGGGEMLVNVDRLQRKSDELQDLAARHRTRVDEALKSQFSLLWRVFTAPRPLMTFINGRCHNVGCGLALLSKFPALRDSSEFIADGPHMGVTPFGGMTNLLARPETSLKYPGLAEFALLTGNALYAGDALRLGWSDLFTTLPDMDYNIKNWFDSSEHMHNDAVAWQLGQLLETCFKMKSHHDSAMERCAITPRRARWIEDAFADQSSVANIMETLSQMEKLPYTDPHNVADLNNVTPFSLPSIEEGLAKLRKNNMAFSLAPWETSAPAEGSFDTEDDGSIKGNMNEVFSAYVFGTSTSGKNVAINSTRQQVRKWRDQRWQEYQDHMMMKNRPMKRHVFAKVEGADGKLIDFEFFFDRDEAVAQLKREFVKKSQLAGTAPTSGDVEFRVNKAMVAQLSEKIAKAAGYEVGRGFELGWYMPTLDTCPIHTDEELLNILFEDTGVESSAHPTTFPPIYFAVKRVTIHLSEWAFAVKHQLLLSSPFALKATFQLLHDVRTTGKIAANCVTESQADSSEFKAAERTIQSISETFSTEHRYASRLMRRSDFWSVGFNSQKSMDEWEELQADAAQYLHKGDKSQNRPTVEYDAVFERNVVVDGHTFLVRPKWSPRTLEEVSDSEIAQLSKPLSFHEDKGLTEIHVPTLTSQKHRIAAAVNDMGGFEVVPGLGEEMSPGSNTFKVPALESNATVPTNVNFYEMARHPWMDVQTSWRSNGFTDASSQYMTDKYHHAVQQLAEGSKTNGAYWPSKEAVEGDGSFEKDEQHLLQDRLYNVLADAEKQVDTWASDLRTAVRTDKIDYKIELATPQERLFDDHFYKYFVRPGDHPNPTGLLKNGAKVTSKKSSSSDDFSADDALAAFEHDEDSLAQTSYDSEGTASVDPAAFVDTE